MTKMVADFQAMQAVGTQLGSAVRDVAPRIGGDVAGCGSQRATDAVAELVTRLEIDLRFEQEATLAAASTAGDATEVLARVDHNLARSI